MYNYLCIKFAAAHYQTVPAQVDNSDSQGQGTG